MQAGDQIGDGDVKQARRSQRKDGRQDVLHGRQSCITGQPSNQRCNARRQIVDKGAAACVSGMHEYREIPDLLRNRVRDDRQRRCRAKREIGNERGSDHDPVAEVVHAVADDDHQSRSSAGNAVIEGSVGDAVVQSLRCVVTVSP